MSVPIWFAATVGVAGVLLSRVDYNLFFMKCFRNLARSKARARLHNNKYAIIPVMLGIEEPMKIKDDLDAEDAMTITREELEEMDGLDGAPLYLSIKGRVYDVSAGDRFYGEGREYHDWVGKDASRSFGTGCRWGSDRTGMDCLSETLEGLTEKELKEIDRWLELYETHDKYKFVGHLVDDPVNDILEQVGDEDEEAGEDVGNESGSQPDQEGPSMEGDKDEVEETVGLNQDEDAEGRDNVGADSGSQNYQEELLMDIDTDEAGETAGFNSDEPVAATSW